MEDRSAPAWTDAFPLRFGACFLLGMLLATGFVWVAASQRWTIPEELLFGVMIVLWSVVSAIFAPPPSWNAVAVAVVIATVLQFMIFFLPPILLIGYPFSNILLGEIVAAMSPYVAGYMLALSLTFLIQSRKGKNRKASHDRPPAP